MLLIPPPPVTNCHTFSDPLTPLEHDVFYGRPLKESYVFMYWLLVIARPLIFIRFKWNFKIPKLDILK